MLNQVVSFLRNYLVCTGTLVRDFVCSGKGSAFETNTATINSLTINQLRSVAAFDPIFAL
jgi:hypothetical protein